MMEPLNSTSRLIEPVKCEPSGTCRFLVEPAQIQEIRVVNGGTNEGVAGAYLVLSDDMVHLVSHTLQTDRQGRARMPLLEGVRYVVYVRARGYLQPPPLRIQNPGEEEIRIELNPGMSLAGMVQNHTGQPVRGAKLHVEVVRPDGSVWNSDLDQPRPVSALVSAQQKIWFPQRIGGQTDETGKFLVQTVPQGKWRIFATHPDYPPTNSKELDASRVDELPPVTLAFPKPFHAWIRVQNASGAAVAAQLTIIDEKTGFELETLKTSSSGAMERHHLPQVTRFRIVQPDLPPYEEVREISEHDEIVLTLPEVSQSSPEFWVTDENGQPIHNATLSLADSSLQKKHPLCLGRTDRRGFVQPEHCPSEAWYEITHASYARHLQFVSGFQPHLTAKLTLGQDLSISVMDKEMPVDASCMLHSQYSDGERMFTATGRLDVRRGTLALNHAHPQVKYHLDCTYGTETLTADFDVGQVPKKLEFPHQVLHKLQILDGFGAPLLQARVVFGSHEIESDRSGQLSVTARPGRRFEVYHWLHGHAVSTVSEDAKVLEIRLPEVPDSELIRCLESHGFAYVTDSAAVRMDAAVSKYSILRGDYVESCDEHYLVLVRQQKRIRVKL